MTSLTITTAIAALLYMASGIGIVAAMKGGKDAKASSLLRWPVLLGLVHAGLMGLSAVVRGAGVEFGFRWWASQ